MHNFKSNNLQALEEVRQMVERGWQPFGLMRSSPLFDSFLSNDTVAAQLAPLEQGFDEMRAQCDSIGLAKLGL